MALSYYSNRVAFQAQLGSGMNTDTLPPTELPPELHQLANAASWNVDSPFDANEFFYSENFSSVQYDCLSGVTSYDDFNSLAVESFLLQQTFEPFHYPIRQKGCEYEEIYPEFKPGFFNGDPNFGNYSAPEFGVLPLPEFPTGPPGYSYGSCQSTVKKEPSSSGSLSAQSVAARQRRRKITEKTQELGKLVPGGQKMNTAEMLQAAYKYIKYLQAQVEVLGFMSSYYQEQEEQFESSDEELHDLLESPLIQEKLYSSEKCLVPQRFVEGLRSDHQMVKSNPELLPLVVKQDHSCSSM